MSAPGAGRPSAPRREQQVVRTAGGRSSRLLPVDRSAGHQRPSRRWPRPGGRASRMGVPAQRPEALRGISSGRVGRGSHDDGLLAHEAPSTRLADRSTVRRADWSVIPPTPVNRGSCRTTLATRQPPGRAHLPGPPVRLASVRLVGARARRRRRSCRRRRRLSTRAPGRARPAAAGAHRGRRALTLSRPVEARRPADPIRHRRPHRPRRAAARSGRDP